MKIKTFVVAAILITCQPAFAGWMTGNRLAGLAKAHERIGMGNGRESDYADSAELAGYLAGAMDALADKFCPPPGITLGQASLVIAKFLAENPKDLDITASLLVTAALRNAYPCAAK